MKRMFRQHEIPSPEEVRRDLERLENQPEALETVQMYEAIKLFENQNGVEATELRAHLERRYVEVDKVLRGGVERNARTSFFGLELRCICIACVNLLLASPTFSHAMKPNARHRAARVLVGGIAGVTPENIKKWTNEWYKERRDGLVHPNERIRYHEEWISRLVSETGDPLETVIRKVFLEAKARAERNKK